MRHLIGLFIAPLTLSLALAAQELPPGSTLPVTLTSPLNNSRVRSGERITARVMQAVSVTPAFEIPAGAKVVGRITEVRPHNETGVQLSLRFDRIVTKKREIPLNAGLRAVASFMEVNDAQIPKTGPDEGTSSYSQTTVQVGCDVRYGTGGPVTAGETEVGKGVVDGVVARVTATPGSECSQVKTTNQLQSLWVFSSGACGAYGLPDLKIQQSGLTAPSGGIVLSSSGKSLRLGSGTGLLLQVVGNSR